MTIVKTAEQRYGRVEEGEPPLSGTAPLSEEQVVRELNVLREEVTSADSRVAAAMTRNRQLQDRWASMQDAVKEAIIAGIAHDIDPEDAAKTIAAACGVELTVERQMTARITVNLTVEMAAADAADADAYDIASNLDIDHGDAEVDDWSIDSAGWDD